MTCAQFLLGLSGLLFFGLLGYLGWVIYMIARDDDDDDDNLPGPPGVHVSTVPVAGAVFVSVF